MPDIINLFLSRNNVFVWSAKDWLKLRRDHRIIGELVGCLPKNPRQEVFLGLPLLLLPEEVSLLVQERIARVIEYPCMRDPPNESLKQTFNEYRETLFLKQEECLKQQKEKQIVAMMDTIVDGKRRKKLGLQTCKKKMKKPLDAHVQESLENIEINTEELLKEEMAKVPKLDKNEALIQTHTAYPWLKESDIKIVEWKYPSTPDEKFRYKVFKDLWERGYFVTSGEKFGGNFLAYPGDPIMFHSQFIIQCKDRNEEMVITELIGQCRIACHVRKSQVFATLSEDGNNVNYQSFQWAESSVLENG